MTYVTLCWFIETLPLCRASYETVRDYNICHAVLVYWNHGNVFSVTLQTTITWTKLLNLHRRWLEGRFPFVPSVRSDQSVLKRNARVLTTGSGQNGPAHGSEPLSSPASVGQSAGSWRVVAGKKCTRAPWNFPFKLARNNALRPTIPSRWKERHNIELGSEIFQLREIKYFIFHGAYYRPLNRLHRVLKSAVEKAFYGFYTVIYLLVSPLQCPPPHPLYGHLSCFKQILIVKIN